MRIFSLISALAALATAVAGVALPRHDTCSKSEMGCDFTWPSTKRDLSDRRFSRAVQGVSNAELLRRGLPLKDPVIRRGTPVRRTSPSNTPHPQPGTITHRGYIRAIDTDNKAVLGFVSSLFSAGQFGNGQAGFKQGLEDALIVSFKTDSTGSGTKLNLVPDDSNFPDFEFLGLVQGRDDITSDLAAGSFQYTYLALTHGTEPGSVPTYVGSSYTAQTNVPRDSESALWAYDFGTGALTPHWVNSDKSLPAVQSFVQSGGFYIGGDQTAFYNRYPAPIIPVVFEFVPI